MDSNIITSLCSLAGAIIGALAASRLTIYRIEQLEKKVEKHNSIIERTFVLERDVKTAFTYIDELKEHQKDEDEKIDNVETRIENRINNLHMT